MIEYVEIRNPETRKIIGICDTAKSIIWRSVYFGVGEFEIYAPATPKYIDLLKIGNFVTRANELNCGIIETIQITFNEQDGQMIVASGRFAKQILSRRIIYRFVKTYSVSPSVISGNVAEACWRLIDENCGASAPSYRQFPKFGRGTINHLPAVITDQNGEAARRQVTYENLLEYTDGLLQEYLYGSYVWLDTFTGDLQYVMYKGADRSANNTEGNIPLIFSKENDNLLSSDFNETDAELKTTAIIGGEGEGLQRFIARVGDDAEGYERREMFVDADGITKTVQEGETETTYTDEEYAVLLIADGKAAMKDRKKTSSFTGDIDLTQSRYVFGRDYFCGDIITVEDSTIGKRANCRMVSIIEAQDENGYSVIAECETV